MSLPLLAKPHKSNELLQFYQLEQANWRDYIARFQALDDQQANFDVTFYYLNVEIAVDSKYIQGDVLCRFRATEELVQSIQLNLHHSLTVDSIRGNISEFRCANDRLEITLEQPLAKMMTSEVIIYYQGVPELAKNLKGLNYSTHGFNEPIIASLSTPFLAHYWWPCKDGPGDKPDSVYVDITIPDRTINSLPLMAVSNGTLENVISKNGKKTFQWRERYPIVPYYVMAAISNYHHFYQFYSGDFGERFPLDYYVFNEDLDASRGGVSQLPEAIRLFSRYFGKYPFSEEKYGMTQLGFYGGIENQTNTIINEMSSGWFDVSVHELAHQWFGDMITCETWQHGWLNEGFATYCEALWEEHTRGFQGYLDHIHSNRYLWGGTLFLEDDTDPFKIFITIIYSKGAYLLHMLRGVLGDSVFFKCLYEYANHPDLRYNHATTEDFQKVCETVSGKDLEFFFDQWVYDEYYPKYEFGFHQNQVTRETQVLIHQNQANDNWRPVFKMPVQLLFQFDNDQDSLISVWNDRQTQHYSFTFKQNLKTAWLDPDEWILREVIEPNTPDVFISKVKINDSGENDNQQAEPGEAVELVLELTNLGAAVSNVRARVTTKDPALNILSATAEFGDISRNQVKSNTSTPFHLAISRQTLGHPAALRVEITGSHNYQKQIDFAVEIGESKILLVDDDAGADYERYFYEIAQAASIQFTPWEIATQNSPADTIHHFEMVLWFTGDDRTRTLTPAEQAVLKSYLEAGGRLCLTGQNIGYDLANNGLTADSSFYAEYLRCQFLEEGFDKKRLIGVGRDPISTNLPHLFLDSYWGAGNQQSPDCITPLEPAKTILKYLPGQQSAAIYYFNPVTNSRLVYLAFGLEGVCGPLPGTAAILLNRIFAWLADCAAPVEIDSNFETVPTAFQLNQNYPNPFNSTTVICYQLPQACQVKLDLFNILGKTVNTLVDNYQNAGFYSLRLYMADLASGIYLYRLQAGNFIKIKKMIILR